MADCRPTRHACVDSDCAGGFICDFRGTCVPEVPGACRDDADCDAGTVQQLRNGLAQGKTQYRTLREVTDRYIQDVLAECDGNKSQAARVLGLSRQGLIDRLKRLSPGSLR